MKILVDLDGIVADTLPSWLQRIYEKTGVKAKLSDVTKWNLNENPPLDALSLSQIFSVLNEEYFNLNLPEMRGASFYLHQLHQSGHDISIVTARHGNNCMLETLAWLKLLMPWLNVEKKVWFCYDKHRITADMLIDDKAETLTKYGEAFPGAHLVTIDYPYNKDAPYWTFRAEKNGNEWETINNHINSLSLGQRIFT